MVDATISIGIDLGTTNSVAAVLVDGQPIIVDNLENRALTPSFVGADSRGELFIGDDAVNLSLIDPDNVAEGFKRLIGTEHTWTFPNCGRSYDPEELSSELLKYIRGYVSLFTGNDAEAAVITVPEVFAEREKDAILNASRIAGFEQVVLVQEPIAAGLAYGWNNRNDAKPFLVYDLGGGTFDVSLLQIVGGQLVVRGHSGLHTLGGRDLDDQIIDQILLPRLENRVDQKEIDAKRRSLRWMAEKAKIRLSTSESAIVAIEGRLSGRNGESIQDVITISRKDFEPLVQPLAERTITVVLQLLTENGVNHEDLQEIILVGGPTLIPALKRSIENSLGVTIQRRVNPMTVVAQGAALHGASIRRQQPSRAKSEESSAVSVQLEYDSVASASMVPFGFKGDENEIPDGCNILIRRSDAQWQSGLIPVNGGKAFTQVMIGEEHSTSFEITLLSESGNRIMTDPDNFQIFSGISAAPPPLTRSIGVSVESLSGIEFDPIASRGDPQPLTSKRRYKTTRTVNPGEAQSAITITFLEGESLRPERNRVIGTINLDGAQLQRAISIDTLVEITLRIDPGSDARATVYIPAYDLTLPHNLRIGRDSISSPHELSEKINQAKYDVEQLNIKSVDTSGVECTLAEAKLSVESAADQDIDNLMRASSAVESLYQDIENLEISNSPSLTFKGLKDIEAWVIEVVEQLGDSRQKEELNKLIESASMASDTNDSVVASRVRTEMLSLGLPVYWTHPDALTYEFNKLLEERDQLIDQDRAKELFIQGQQAFDSNDYSIAKKIVADLLELSPDPNKDDPSRRFQGLRRG